MRRAVAHVWDFSNENRAECEISDDDKVRIDPRMFSIHLKPDSSGNYPLDADLYVRAQAYAPTAARQWLAFCAQPTLPEDEDGNVVGAVQYRLNDGADDRYWTGATWAVAGASDWNTLAEVQDGLASWELGTVRPVFNLVTTDKRYTPSLDRALLAFYAEIPSFIEDVVVRTFMPDLEATLRPEADLAYVWGGGTSMVLPEQEEEAVVITEAGSAYDETSDPNLTTDILSSYNPVTRALTLTQSVAAGSYVLLRAQVRPSVVLATHPDYDEVASLPAVAISEIEEVGWSRDIRKEWLRNVATGEGVGIQSPRVANWRLGLRLIAARTTELLRLTSEASSFVEKRPVIACSSLDTRVDLVLESGPTVAGRTDRAHVQEARMQIGLRSVKEWFLSESESYAVQRVFLDEDLDATV